MLNLAIGYRVTSCIVRSVLAQGAHLGDQVITVLISRTSGQKFGLLAWMRMLSIGYRLKEFVHLSNCLINER